VRQIERVQIYLSIIYKEEEMGISPEDHSAEGSLAYFDRFDRAAKGLNTSPAIPSRS
jgi:hypothetical protein